MDYCFFTCDHDLGSPLEMGEGNGRLHLKGKVFLILWAWLAGYLQAYYQDHLHNVAFREGEGCGSYSRSASEKRAVHVHGKQNYGNLGIITSSCDSVGRSPFL